MRHWFSPEPLNRCTGRTLDAQYSRSSGIFSKTSFLNLGLSRLSKPVQPVCHGCNGRSDEQLTCLIGRVMLQRLPRHPRRPGLETIVSQLLE